MKPFPWKCGTCRQRALAPAVAEYREEVEHDGRVYTIVIPALQVLKCANCGALVLDDDANRQVSEALRREAGLLSPAEIRQQREALGLTQKQLANCLQVGESTLSRWETGGQIQQRSLDRFLRAFFCLPQVRAFLQEIGGDSPESERTPPPGGRPVVAAVPTAGVRGGT
jgi:putative zinc finger/helix-turn-helix YgiT family protein